MKRFALALSCLLFAAATVQASTLFRYSFDNRIDGGTRVKIPNLPGGSTGNWYQESHQTFGSYKDFGPTLYSAPAAYSSYTRMYYNNNATGSEGRQTLEYAGSNHTPTYYRTEGAGPLPSSGSFTWELVARVDAFSGPQTFGRSVGVLFDNSYGDFRLPSYGTTSIPTVANRLEVRTIVGDASKYELYFWLGTNTVGGATSVSVVLDKYEYYHIAAVYDDDAHVMSLYIDEVMVASKSATGVAVRSTNFALGDRSIDCTKVTHGMKTNFAFFDVVSASGAALEPVQFYANNPMPEPATMGLLLMAGAGLARYVRRRRG